MAIGTTAAILGASALGAAGSIASNSAQSKAAKSAANASQQATDASIAEQRRQFDIAQQNQQPWLNTGTAALGQLASLYGLSTGVGSQPSTGQGFNEAGYLLANPDVAASIQQGGFGGSALNHYNQYGQAEGRQGGVATTGQVGGATATPSGMDAFFTSPDYQFRQNEQARALTARNASLGIQDSGAAQKAALQYSGNLASGEFNNYANRLASLAGVGQSAANQSAQQGQNFANNFSNLQGQNAQNLGSSYMQQGQNTANMWGNLANIGAGALGVWGNR
jgi:hypothetical protein